MQAEPATAELARTFPAVAAAVPDVRRFVDDAWRRLPCTGRRPDGDLALVASELATNVVLHAGSRFSVSLRCEGTGVRLVVGDDDPSVPAQADPSGSTVGGRGLHIVEVLAASWGVDRRAHGKAVWARFPAPRPR